MEGLISDALGAIVDKIGRFLYDSFWAIPNAIWSFFLKLTLSVIKMDPRELGEGGSVWDVLSSNGIFALLHSMGYALLTIFLLIGYLRQMTDIRQQASVENLIRFLIKLVIASALFTSMIPIMFELTGISSAMVEQIEIMSTFTMSIEKGSMSPNNFKILIFLLPVSIIAAFVCGFKIFLSVYKRFIHLYVLLLLSPLATATLAGDEGISNSGVTWIKATIACIFEVVVIALAIAVSGVLLSKGILSAGDSMATFLPNVDDGILMIVESTTMMVCTSSAVAGAERFLKSSFAL